MRSLLAAGLCFLLSPVLLIQPAQTSSSNDTKRQDIRKLMALTGSQKLGEQVLEQMFLQLKSQLPKVPESFWKEVRSKIDFNEMLEQMVPVHEKCLTHEEIKELIKFYESPVGQKLVSVMPRISEETTVAGQKWVLGVGQMIEKKLEEGGYK